MLCGNHPDRFSTQRLKVVSFDNSVNLRSFCLAIHSTILSVCEHVGKTLFYYMSTRTQQARLVDKIYLNRITSLIKTMANFYLCFF